MADDVFVIENGAMLRGYPRRAESPAAFKWPNEDARWVEAELFRGLVLERERARNEGIFEKLARQISELKSRVQSYKDRLRNALARCD